MNTTVPSRPEVIVIGGSAGALDVVSRVLSRLPTEFVLPIVIVLHLPKEHPSHLAEILTRAANRTVTEAQDKDRLLLGDTFVAPPGYHLLLARGPSFALSLDAPIHYSRPSIDVLFESAADVFGSRVLGILLSGANEDGARGLAAIVAVGGSAVVQDPAEAANDTMPAAGRRWVPAAEVLDVDGIVEHLRLFVAEGSS